MDEEGGKKDIATQGRRKHLKLGGARHFKGTFFIKQKGHFLKQKGHFLKQKGQFLVYCKILGGGTCPQCPRFLLLCYLFNPIRKSTDLSAMTYCLFLASVDELLAKSDFVLACCALNSETKGNSIFLKLTLIFCYLDDKMQLNIALVNLFNL